VSREPAGTTRRRSGQPTPLSETAEGVSESSAPTYAQRQAAHIVAVAYTLGYRLAIRCRVCGRWLVAESSVRAHIGPRCRAKVPNRDTTGGAEADTTSVVGG
jgi:phage FluMu protein Com